MRAGLSIEICAGPQWLMIIVPSPNSTHNENISGIRLFHGLSGLVRHGMVLRYATRPNLHGGVEKRIFMLIMTRKSVLAALTAIVDPDRKTDIVRLGLIRNLEVKGRVASFAVSVSRPDSRFAQTLAARCREVVREAHGDGADARVHMISGKGRAKSIRLGANHMIAVASGKGGVGKSTVAANLAVALAQQGFRTGLVDADIYGPSVPTMFGVEDEKPRVNEERKIVPLFKYGVRLLSMGLLVDPEHAVIWRGPMVSSAVRQFLGDAEWGDLDFLILDLPPGTGDIQLTIVQTVSLTGAVIVSTPQRVALADARKGIAMFKQVNVPVLGIVENMAYFAPPDLPERKYYLFGQGGAQKLAVASGVPLLGEVPLEQCLRESGDEGAPIVIAAPESASAQVFRAAADRVVFSVARNAEAQTALPEIVYR